MVGTFIQTMSAMLLSRSRMPITLFLLFNNPLCRSSNSRQRYLQVPFDSNLWILSFSLLQTKDLLIYSLSTISTHILVGRLTRWSAKSSAHQLTRWHENIFLTLVIQILPVYNTTRPAKRCLFLTNFYLMLQNLNLRRTYISLTIPKAHLRCPRNTNKTFHQYHSKLHEADWQKRSAKQDHSAIIAALMLSHHLHLILKPPLHPPFLLEGLPSGILLLCMHIFHEDVCKRLDLYIFPISRLSIYS